MAPTWEGAVHFKIKPGTTVPQGRGKPQARGLGLVVVEDGAGIPLVLLRSLGTERVKLDEGVYATATHGFYLSHTGDGSIWERYVVTLDGGPFKGGSDVAQAFRRVAPKGGNWIVKHTPPTAEVLGETTVEDSRLALDPAT